MYASQTRLWATPRVACEASGAGAARDQRRVFCASTPHTASKTGGSAASSYPPASASYSERTQTGRATWVAVGLALMHGSRGSSREEGILTTSIEGGLCAGVVHRSLNPEHHAQRRPGSWPYPADELEDDPRYLSFPGEEGRCFRRSRYPGAGLHLTPGLSNSSFSSVVSTAARGVDLVWFTSS